MVFIRPRDGRIQADDVIGAVNQDTLLVSAMAVNNETGGAPARGGDVCGRETEKPRCTGALRLCAGIRKDSVQLKPDKG